MALIKCWECDAEVSQKAATCPKCGAPAKQAKPAKPATKKSSDLTGLIATVLGSGLFGLWLVGYLSTPSASTQLSSPDRSAQQPPESKPAPSAHSTGWNLDYRSAALDQLSAGTPLTFYGQVLQLVGTNDAMLATNRVAYNEYVGDDVYLVFENAPDILENDILDVRGRYEGTVRYKTVLGVVRRVPKIRVDSFRVR
jgi:zinc ribbon protein